MIDSSVDRSFLLVLISSIKFWSLIIFPGYFLDSFCTQTSGYHEQDDISKQIALDEFYLPRQTLLLAQKCHNFRLNALMTIVLGKPS